MKTEKEQEYLDRIAELEKELKRTHHKIKKDNYGLHWLDVPEAFEDDVENKLPILKEVKEKAIVNNDGKPTHILIEGDNYHALTCLNYTHKGKIDVIYIDPPYNTGTDGFKYKDKRFLTEFPDGTEVPVDHPLRHSYWLSFMSKRLKLAKDLLKNDGIILISIDDNEFSNVSLLCNKIFGIKNFIGSFIWEKKKKGSHLSKTFRSMTEYVVCFSNDYSAVNLFGEKAYSDKWQPLAKRTNSKKDLVFPPNVIETKLDDGIYEKGNKGQGSSSLDFSTDIIVKDGYVINKINVNGPFVWTQSKLDEELENGTIPSLSKKYGFNVLRSDQSEKTKTPTSLLNQKIGVGTNEDANEELKMILGREGTFDYPKPTSLLKYLVNSRTQDKKGGVVLDFFAGTGSTAHSVMSLNNEDGGKRQWILVTNNEDNIMTDVCYPRINNIIKGFNYEGKHKEILFKQKLNWTAIKNSENIINEVDKLIAENNDSGQFDKIKKEIKSDIFKVIGEKEITDKFPGLGNSLKYYKTEFVGEHNILGATDQDKPELAHHAGEMLAIAENTLYEMEEYQTDFYQFFHNEKHYTAVYFREELEQFEEFRKKVLALENPVSVYVFSWGENEFADQFDDRDDIEVKPIPQPILEVYKTIYNLSD